MRKHSLHVMTSCMHTVHAQQQPFANIITVLISDILHVYFTNFSPSGAWPLSFSSWTFFRTLRKKKTSLCLVRNTSQAQSTHIQNKLAALAPLSQFFFRFLSQHFFWTPTFGSPAWLRVCSSPPRERGKSDSEREQELEPAILCGLTRFVQKTKKKECVVCVVSLSSCGVAI